MNRSLEIADSFAVDNAHLENPPLSALLEVGRHKLLHVAWIKGVQIQHAGDGNLKRLIHHL